MDHPSILWQLAARCGDDRLGTRVALLSLTRAAAAAHADERARLRLERRARFDAARAAVAPALEAARRRTVDVPSAGCAMRATVGADARSVYCRSAFGELVVKDVRRALCVVAPAPGVVAAHVECGASAYYVDGELARAAAAGGELLVPLSEPDYLRLNRACRRRRPPPHAP